MKHPRLGTVADPEAIAKATVKLVEDFFQSVGYARDAEFPKRLHKFAATLALWGSRTDLTAHPENPEELAFHVIDSVTPAIIAARDGAGPLADAFGKGQNVLDLGSGAGFPGLVLAAATGAHFTVAETRRKRSSFLSVAAGEMGLANITVWSARVVPSSFCSEFDTVTARAFARPAEVYPIASAALKLGGLLILFAAPSQRLQLDRARASGFVGYRRILYGVKRGARHVPHVLALWHKGRNGPYEMQTKSQV